MTGDDIIARAVARMRDAPPGLRAALSAEAEVFVRELLAMAIDDPQASDNDPQASDVQPEVIGSTLTDGPGGEGGGSGG